MFFPTGRFITVLTPDFKFNLVPLDNVTSTVALGINLFESSIRVTFNVADLDVILPTLYFRVVLCFKSMTSNVL